MFGKLGILKHKLDPFPIHFLAPFRFILVDNLDQPFSQLRHGVTADQIGRSDYRLGPNQVLHSGPELDMFDRIEPQVLQIIVPVKRPVRQIEHHGGHVVHILFRDGDSNRFRGRGGDLVQEW